MKPCDTSRAGVAPRQVARNLSQQQLREVLTAVTQTPTQLVLMVGHVLRLFVAVLTTEQPTSDRVGGSGNRGGLAAVPETSRRVIRAAAGAPAARRRSSLTIEKNEEAVAIIAAATKEMKQARRADTSRAKGGNGAAKRRAGGEQAKLAQSLQIWAAKTKRSLPPLLELLESGTTAIGADHAKLIKFHSKDIPVEKAARVSAAVELCITSRGCGKVKVCVGYCARSEIHSSSSRDDDPRFKELF